MESPGSGFAACVNYGQYQCTCPTVWWGHLSTAAVGGIYPPPPCAFCAQRRHHRNDTCRSPRSGTTGTTNVFTSQKVLSDAEIDRIARRVAELLQES